MNVYNTEVDMYLSHRNDCYADLWDILSDVYTGTGCWPICAVTVLSLILHFLTGLKDKQINMEASTYTQSTWHRVNQLLGESTGYHLD